MQNETNLYEMPPDRMVFTHQGLGQGRELGEVEIVSTMWGKARVRPVGKQDRSGWAWLLAALLLLGAAAAAWLMLSGKETGYVEPHLLTAPQETAPAAPQPDVPAHAPDEHAAPSVPAPAPAVVATPEPVKPTQPGTTKPQPAGGKALPPATEKHPAAETPRVPDKHPPARPARAEQPGKVPATVNTPSPGAPAPASEKLGGPSPDTGKAGGSPAPAKPASTTMTAPTGNLLGKTEVPVKPEQPVKADATDTRP